jgi:oligosaccharide repeat unit polymerase
VSFSLSDASPVIWPLVAILIAAFVYLRWMRKNSVAFDVLEVGVFYPLLVLLYAIFPILSFLIGDLSFSPLSDIRLFQAQPSPEEMAPICWYYALYFCAFAATYAWMRGRSGRSELRLEPPPPYTVPALIISLLLIEAVFLIVRVVYGLRAAETYGDLYLMYRDLPRLLQQILNHFNGMTFTLEIMIVAILVRDFRKYRYWILGWVAAQFFSVFFVGIGSRTNLLVPMVSLVACYHFAVRRFTVKAMLALGLVAMLVFLALGVARNLEELDSDAGLNPFGYANEFESIFANAYEVSHLKADGETKAVFPEIYFADVLSLVPRQIVPFEKLDVAAWYVNTFYPDWADSGGGFAFGAIPESILGLGWIDVVWRGAALGALFAWLHRRFTTKRQSIWGFGFYIWVLIFSYQCFRGGTFALLPRAFYQFFLVFVWIRLLTRVNAHFMSRRQVA